MSQVILTLLFIGLLVVLYIWNGKKTSEVHTVMSYDLIVKFNDSCYRDIRRIDSFEEIALWTRYGEYGFRGFSKLKKEELEQFIIETLDLSKDNFKVINANPGLFLPS